MKNNPKKQHFSYDSIQLRYEVRPADPEKIRYLATLTDFFRPDEVDVAEELVHERLAKGDISGYYFILAELYSRLIGYVCYGPIACTTSSYDLFWMAVHPDFQGRGLGKWLIEKAENLICKAGGTRIYVETSQREQYAGTRAFYEDRGYRAESVLADFYAPGDAKVTYCKILS